MNLRTQGIESIRELLRECANDARNADLCAAYHGLLIDNIECDKSLYTAVEASVASRLFYHIVETDAHAMRLLRLMNQHKMHGEVNYLPLNVLRSENGGDIVYPESNDAIALISKLTYAPKVEKAVRHVFERVLLCRTGEFATQFAKQTRMDCVLLDGELVSRKGALTGGYVDSRQSKLALYRQKREIDRTIGEKERQIAAMQADVRDLDAQLNGVFNELQKHEARGKRNRDTFEQMRVDLSSRKAEIERYERQKASKERSEHSLLSDIAQLEAKREMLEAELGTELLTQLSGDEQANVDALNERVHTLNQQVRPTIQIVFLFLLVVKKIFDFVKKQTQINENLFSQIQRDSSLMKELSQMEMSYN